MDARFSILQCLPADDRLVLIQDGREVRAGELRTRAAKLESDIAKHAWRRVALVSGRADTLVAALAGVQQSRCDLLLLREDYPPEDPVWAAWQAEALLDDDLQVRRTFASSPPEATGSILLTTSGTTGKPKVAVHSIEVLASRAMETKSRAEGSRWLLTFHPASFAGLQVILTVVVGGSELIALAHPNMTNLVQAAHEGRPTHISATPTFWRSLLVAVSATEHGLPLQQITIGGEAVDQSTLNQLRRAYPQARLAHIYASTEAGALFAVRDGQAGFPAAWLESSVSGTRLRIRDGVLEILSPREMRGYVGDSAPKNRTDDGWLVSGDLVEVTGDRVLFKGRTDNVINVGGAKVMPEEVENVLLQHEAVREARVFGQRNPLVGAVVCAEIVLASGFDEQTARASIFSHAARHMEQHKLPRLLRFVPSIPTNAAGKKVRQS